MSTNDVPGHVADNNDKLAMGCWAEHEDGSLILVESVEVSRVVYSVFDMQSQPIVEYRDAMPEKGFKAQFSWPASVDHWTWHDKTPFPWDRVIRDGASPGSRYASADDLLTAAQRVARSRDLHGRDYSPTLDDTDHLLDVERGRLGKFVDKLQSAINDLKP